MARSGSTLKEQKMSIKRKIISVVLAAGVAGGATTGISLMGSGTATAAPRASATQRTAAIYDCIGLSALVSNGTITQAQETAIQKAMLSYTSAMGRNYGSSATIRSMMQSRSRMMAAVLGQLVANSTITQAQDDAIIDWMSNRDMMNFGDGSAASGYGMMRNVNSSAASGYGMMSNVNSSAATGYGMMDEARFTSPGATSSPS